MGSRRTVLARLLAVLDRLPRGDPTCGWTVLFAARGCRGAGGVAGLRPEQPGSRGPAGGPARRRHRRVRRRRRRRAPAREPGSDAAGRRRRRWRAARWRRRSTRRGAFVESYVAFSYGRARLGAIRSADPALLRTFAGQRARVPPAAAQAPPARGRVAGGGFSPGVARRDRGGAATVRSATRWCSSWTGGAGGWLVTRDGRLSPRSSRGVGDRDAQRRARLISRRGAGVRAGRGADASR